MARIKKLLDKARRSRHNYRFSDLCKLAQAAGFRFRRQSGSHAIFKHDEFDGYDAMLNVQEVKGGKAKPSQVRDLLKVIDEYNLLEE